MRTMTDKELAEVIKGVAARLDAQGRPARTDTMCFYRTPEGLKCAIGQMLTDEVYGDGAVEGESMDSIYTLKAVEKSLDAKLTDEQIDALIQLQTIHDHQWKPSKGGFSQAMQKNMGHMDALSRIMEAAE